MTIATIRRARPDEAEEITRLGICSKVYWGYTSEQMQVFQQELSLQPESIKLKSTCVIELDRKLIGYYTLLPQDEETVELEHLFVAPSHFRQGFGSQLLQHAQSTARAQNFQRMLIQSDPNAANFYVAHGARLIKTIPSSIPGRVIPLLEIHLR